MKIFDRVCSGVDMAVVLLGAVQGLIETGKRYRITIAEFDKRSTPQNDLYWQWLTQMAKYFSRKGAKYSKEEMHDLMRHLNLGYVEKKIGNTELKPQLRSTTDMTKKEMSEYMLKIEAWAADHGCLLPHPEDNEFTKYREAQAA